VADRSVSVPMTLSNLKKWDAMGHFFSRISLITLVPFDLEQPYVGRGVFLGVSNAVPQGAGPKRNPILGVTSIYAYTL